MNKYTFYIIFAIMIALFLIIQGCADDEEDKEEREAQKQKIKQATEQYKLQPECEGTLDEPCAISNQDDCEVGATYPRDLFLCESTAPTPRCQCQFNELCTKTHKGVFGKEPQEGVWRCVEVPPSRTPRK